MNTLPGILAALSLFTAIVAVEPAPATPGATPTSELSSPGYDVVSVRPNTSGSNGMALQYPPNGMKATNISLKLLLMNAYDIRPELMKSLPAWGDNDRFDISAKFVEHQPENITKEQRREWLRVLLQDRFGLKAHIEVKNLPVYDLIVVNKQLIEAKEADRRVSVVGTSPLPVTGSMSVSSDEFDGKAVTIEQLLPTLEGEMSRKVIDKTELSGRYDIHLKWLTEREALSQSNSSSVDAKPPLMTAIREQLGLRLIHSVGPVDVLVVDNVDHPRAN